MKLLVVVDMQKDFVNMALGTKEAAEIVPVVAGKIKTAKDAIVVTTFDTHDGGYMNTLEGEKLPVPHCIFGTEGYELVEEVAKALAENPGGYKQWIKLSKFTFGTFDFRDILDNNPDIDEIEICGLCTDICVISNALILRAMRPNMKIVIDHAACAGVTPKKHEAALEVAASCQIDVI